MYIPPYYIRLVNLKLTLFIMLYNLLPLTSHMRLVHKHIIIISQDIYHGDYTPDLVWRAANKSCSAVLILTVRHKMQLKIDPSNFFYLIVLFVISICL